MLLAGLLGACLEARCQPAADWEEEDLSPYSHLSRSRTRHKHHEDPRPAPAFRKTPAEPALETTDEAIIRQSSSSEGTAPLLHGNIEKTGLNELRGSGRIQLPGSTQAHGQTAYATQRLRAAPPFVPPVKSSVPPRAFRAWLEAAHREFALSTSELSRDLVVDVKGQWDKAGTALKALGIKHTSIRPSRLAYYSLDRARVVIVNCPGEIKREELQKLRDFVTQGGYLISTDWSLDNVIKMAFPGFIEWNRGETSSSMMDAVVVTQDPEITTGTVPYAGWKVDRESHTVRVVRPTMVDVLVRSRKLAARDDPDRLGILAVTFRFGRGRVLHLVGHFDNNSSLAFRNMLPDPAPQIGISLRQAIAANFVVSALKPDNRQQPPPVQKAK